MENSLYCEEERKMTMWVSKRLRLDWSACKNMELDFVAGLALDTLPAVVYLRCNRCADWTGRCSNQHLHHRAD